MREENKRLQAELDRVKMENQYLRAESPQRTAPGRWPFSSSTSPSKTIAARIIGNTTGAGAKVVFVDRGSTNGIEKGMAVITPGRHRGQSDRRVSHRVLVLLITDPTFAAGVVSQKNHVHGTLKGQGYSTVTIDYVQNEEKVEPGEWFYTSGDDRIFPPGLPVGTVSVARAGKARKEIIVTPSGLQNAGGCSDRGGRRACADSRGAARSSIDSSPASAARRRRNHSRLEFALPSRSAHHRCRSHAGAISKAGRSTKTCLRRTGWGRAKF